MSDSYKNVESHITKTLKIIVMTYTQCYESSVVQCVHVYIVSSVHSNSIINQSHHTIQDLTKMIACLIF